MKELVRRGNLRDDTRAFKTLKTSFSSLLSQTFTPKQQTQQTQP